MKKFLSCFIALLLTVSSVACAKDTSKDTNTTEITETESYTYSDTDTDASSAEETTSGEEESSTSNPPILQESKINAISPQNGDTVVLANSRVASWAETYRYKTTNSFKHCLIEDLYFPEPVLLQWSFFGKADYYLVYLSKTADFAEYESYLVNTPSLSLSLLYVDTDYYWQVFAGKNDDIIDISPVFSFTTASSPRCVKIDGVSNTRDIGGIPCDGGKRIKQGMVYRGANIDKITDEGKNTFVNELSIKTDLDLRGSGESGYATKSPAGDSVNYYRVGILYYESTESGLFSKEGKQKIAEAIKVFANPDNYPIYYHCRIGRDRTGNVGLLLEGLLGASQNEIMKDYELSYFSESGSPTSQGHLQSLRTHILNTYQYISSNYRGKTYAEKVEKFLLECGVTAEEIQSIRDILLEEAK